MLPGYNHNIFWTSWCFRDLVPSRKLSAVCMRWPWTVTSSWTHWLTRACLRSLCVAELDTPISKRWTGIVVLTHWGRVTHICFGKLTIIGSDNGLSPGRRQAIILSNAGILLIRPKRTNFSEILNEIRTFSLKKMHLNVSSAKRRPYCLGVNVLTPLLPIATPLRVINLRHHWFR